MENNTTNSSVADPTNSTNNNTTNAANNTEGTNNVSWSDILKRIDDMSAEIKSFKDENEALKAENKKLKDENIETKATNLRLARNISAEPKQTPEEILASIFFPQSK